MSQYLEKLNNINSRFYKLLYKKMKGKISGKESNELSVITNYFICNPWQSSYFYDMRFERPMNEMQMWIVDILNEAIGLENEDAFLWELQRIYRNSKMISFEQVHETQNDALFYAWYCALTQESKDTFITNWYRHKVDNSILHELIKRGGKIVYADSDLPQTSFDRAELDKFEGEKRQVKHLHTVKKIFCDMSGHNAQIFYNQYQVIINTSAMENIEMEHKYKKKDPIKYWEFIKQGSV